ncbi:MAG: hypothetical protein BV459_06485 [Thermoplasmata archaeon M11B2D]|nr:MAG: hypothetical protein BV459_06485 [Thermoplasmata archaeon M11B2D]
MSNKKTNLIGLSGKARVGKDTSADYLVGLTGYQKYSFARPIKDACNHIFMWDERHSDGELKECVDPFWGISPRYAYQTLGTEWGRDIINKDIWLMRAIRVAEQCNGLIIPDVRFENEASFIRTNGGILIHIERDGAEKVLQHASEAGIKKEKTDFVVFNNGSVDELWSALDAIFLSHIVKRNIEV